MRKSTLVIIVTAILLFAAIPLKSPAESIPTKVGQCTNTRVVKVGTRLEDVAGSGTAVNFSNGISLISYDTVPQAEESKPGDKVKICLKSIPKNCPPNDDRGRVYTVTNLRTKKKFTLPDSQHQCGGS
jgi:hypothetical protein